VRRAARRAADGPPKAEPAAIPPAAAAVEARKATARRLGLDTAGSAEIIVPRGGWHHQPGRLRLDPSVVAFMQVTVGAGLGR